MHYVDLTRRYSAVAGLLYYLEYFGRTQTADLHHLKLTPLHYIAESPGQLIVRREGLHRCVSIRQGKWNGLELVQNGWSLRLVSQLEVGLSVNHQGS